MMIPITRKEQYINEIVGGGDTAPGTPQTREEFFYAAILGEVVAPFPITNIEKYLAKIAGKYNGELPEPITRIEFFIARAAGMDVTIPTPITREEIFWSNYTAIVEFELEGVPPLSYKAKKAGTLSNYRIYGNTVSGESVGDRTANLFNKNDPSMIYPNTNISNPDDWVRYDGDACVFRIPCKSNQTYTLSISSRTTLFRISTTSSENVPVINSGVSMTRIINTENVKEYTFTTPGTAKYILFQPGKYDIEMAINTLIVNEGSTALPYEPYGYRVPVTVTNGTDTQTTNIYLPEQIRKVGDEAEYIDYGEQKFHRISGADLDVTLPALPAVTGTNVLSVGTEVQPSDVYIKYEGAR